MLLTLPGGKRQTDPKARETALLREARELLDRLDRAASFGEGRRLLTMAISRIYAVPLSAVLALKRSEAAVEGAARSRSGRRGVPPARSQGTA